VDSESQVNRHAMNSPQGGLWGVDFE
jgi:hypothetical protein